MEPKTIEAFEPLLAAYGKRKHPLDYGNRAGAAAELR